MPANIEIYRDIAIRAIESVFESEYHNTLGIPMPLIKLLMPDDADYITGQYYIMINDTWQIHLNFGKLPVSFKEFEDEVKVLTRHEIEHYMCCPFDVITYLRMLKCIKDVYKKEFSHLGIDIERARGLIANHAADIIVDTKNYLRNPQETLISEINWIKKGANIKNCPRHSKLLFLTKEALWQTSLEINETDHELLDIVHDLAEKFKANGIEDRASFLKKTKEYARTFFSLYIKDKLSPQTDGQQGGQSQQGEQFLQGDGDITPVKTKDGDKNGSAFIFADPDKIKEAITVLAEETDVQEFSDILSAAGIQFPTESEKHKLWFAIQGANIIPIEEYANSGNKEEYTFPSIWRLGDPIDTLDIMLSFQTSPKILPGITTKKWEKSTNDIDGIEKRNKDLLLVMDTSSSMGNVLYESSNMHQAVLAAFGIISYFEQIQGKIALIEFNERIGVNINWTDDYEDVRSQLLVNGQGGTTFPISAIRNTIDKTKNEIVTIIITDGELGNLQESLNYFREYINNDNILYIFIIGQSRTLANYEKLKDIGAKVFQSNKAEEFCNMVMDDIN